MAMWLTLCKKIDPEIRFTFNQKKEQSLLDNTVAVKSASKEVKEMG